jgi:hypothetical protein
MLSGMLLAAVMAWGLLLTLGEAAEPGRATLPQRVAPDVVQSAGRVVQVAAGDDLQAALDAARPGDTLELEAGAVFVGNFVLPRKDASDWISIRVGPSSRGLPPQGTRVSPGDLDAMATLTAASGALLTAAPGARRYQITGIAFRPARDASRALNALIWLGDGSQSPDELPGEIIIERCYLQGDPRLGARRGIVMNSGATLVRDSYLADFKTQGSDSQAIIGWAGPGPYGIINNYLEAAGENLMFGGGDPSIEGLVPSDITVTGNHFAKPLSWKRGEPGYDDTNWQVKNLLELKNARRVLVSGNVFEHNWVQAQNGFAILFTVRNQDGTAPWSVVQDVTFADNIVREVGSGINILGFDDIRQSQQTQRIHIDNNLFTGLGGRWGRGVLLQLLNGTDSVVVEHNTAMNTDNILMTEGRVQSGFAFRRNIVMHDVSGFVGAGTVNANDTLRRYFDAPEVQGNLIVGARAALYPRDNEFPRDVAAVGFRDLAQGDLRLGPQSRFASSTPGATPGVDLTRLCAALSSSERPSFCVEEPPSAMTSSFEAAPNGRVQFQHD